MEIFLGSEEVKKKERFLALISSFRSTRSNHVKLIKQHWFNFEAEILIPICIESKSKIGAQLIEQNVSKIAEIFKSSQKETFYYEVEGPIVDLFTSSDFLNNFMRNKSGRFYAISPNSQIDKNNSISIIHDHSSHTSKMILSVNKETYFELGLVGTAIYFKNSSLSNHSQSKSSKLKKNAPFYSIEIDLTEESLIQGSKNFERLVNSLSKLSNSTLLCSWTKDSKCSEINFPKSFKVNKKSYFQNSEIHSRIKIPCVKYINKDGNKLNEEEEEHITDIYDWLGLFSVNSSIIKEDYIENNFISSSFLNLQYNKGNENRILSIKWKGFIHPDFINSKHQLLRELMKENSSKPISHENLNSQIPFGMMSVFGFSDSPISWGPNNHNYSYSGENDYLFVMLPPNQEKLDVQCELPEEPYWHLSILNSYDALT